MTLWELIGHFVNENGCHLVSICCLDKTEIPTFNEVVYEHSAKEVGNFEVIEWSYDFKNQVLAVELQGYWDAEKRAKMVKVSDIKKWSEAEIVKITKAYYYECLGEGWESKYIGFLKTDTGLVVKYTDDDGFPKQHYLDDDEIIDLNKLCLEGLDDE